MRPDEKGVVVTDGAHALDPRFLAALATVPTSSWDRWFHERPASVAAGVPWEPTLVAAFALPASAGQAAICIFETRSGPGTGALHQAVLRRWSGRSPQDAQILYQEVDAEGTVVWTLASAWADPYLRGWLREALSAGASLRAEGWEWLATPERPAASRSTDGSSRQLEGRRHDVVLLPPGAVAIAYRHMTHGGQPELDLLRHLERVPGIRVAPTLLGSAIVRAPNGERTASAVLEDIEADAATVRSVLVGRLQRALDGDPSLQAVALDDVRAVGIITRELHAALGRPFEQGVLAGAQAAALADVETWVARAWTALSQATLAAQASTRAEATRLLPALSMLPGKLQQFAAAAERAPGLVHRTHGNLRLDTILMAPPRVLSVVEFDGDALLPDAERIAPQSPWRDVARLLVSLAEAAAAAATLVGGDEKAFEIAWLWEREARKAYLEGYGTGGGALHALLAIFELEFASQYLTDALASGGDTAVAAHTLQRLSRTIP